MKYAYGSFENDEKCALIGIAFEDDIGLAKKIRKLERYGWHYDGVYVPLKVVDELPSYIDMRV